MVREGATQVGATQNLGTPIYMAPEQFRLGSKHTPTADIFALGMVAFTLLVGRAYWSREMQAAGDVLALVLAVAQGPQEPATQRAAARGITLPPGFDAWFAKVTAPNPADRFQRASEAISALADLLTTPDATTAEIPSLPVVPATTPRQITPLEPPAPAPPPPAFEAPTTAPSIRTPEAPTATSSAVTLVQAKRSKMPLVPAAMALGLGALVTGGWLALRPRADVPAPSPATASTTSAAPPAETTPPPRRSRRPPPRLGDAAHAQRHRKRGGPGAQGREAGAKPAPAVKKPAPTKDPLLSQQ